MDVQSVADGLFFTTVRIETAGPRGELGSGTGFFFAYHTMDDFFPFVVTNKHVVTGTVSGLMYFHLENSSQPVLDKIYKHFESEKSWTDMWFGHPDDSIDIAITPLVPILKAARDETGFDIFLRYVQSTDLPSPARLAAMDSLQSVTFVGYPNGIWDKTNRLPIIRNGMAATPLAVDFEGSPKFLIDASVFGGSSGSPVVIVKGSRFTMKSGVSVSEDPGLIFLGVVAAVYFRTGVNEVLPLPIPTQASAVVEQQEMLDLGIVYKASTVTEAIEAFLVSRGVPFKPLPAIKDEFGGLDKIIRIG